MSDEIIELALLKTLREQLIECQVNGEELRERIWDVTILNESLKNENEQLRSEIEKLVHKLSTIEVTND